jgi:hypothetical protein
VIRREVRVPQYHREAAPATQEHKFVESDAALHRPTIGHRDSHLYVRLSSDDWSLLRERAAARRVAHAQDLRGPARPRPRADAREHLKLAVRRCPGASLTCRTDPQSSIFSATHDVPAGYESMLWVFSVREPLRRGHAPDVQQFATSAKFEFWQLKEWFRSLVLTVVDAKSNGDGA